MTHISSYTKVLIPADQVLGSTLSIPAAKRLSALPSMRDMSAGELRTLLTDLGATFVDSATTNKSLEALVKQLETLETSRVWLVPNVMQAKPSYENHMRAYLERHAPSVFGFGLRDILQNRFRFAYLRDSDPSIIARPGEALESRLYAVLYAHGNDGGRISIGTARFSGSSIQIEGESECPCWAVALTPVVWDGSTVPIATRIGYQADLRHEFRIPPPLWNSVLKELDSLLDCDSDPRVTGSRILHAAARLGLKTETRYYLGAIGITTNGDLVCINGHRSADEIARELIRNGAVRGVLNEEGGSCAYALWECERDFRAADSVRRTDGVPVWDASPRFFGMTTYWRNAALALGVLHLRDVVIEEPLRHIDVRSTFAPVKEEGRQ